LLTDKRESNAGALCPCGAKQKHKRCHGA
jgi:uncharacterized protein YchJ